MPSDPLPPQPPPARRRKPFSWVVFLGAAAAGVYFSQMHLANERAANAAAFAKVAEASRQAIADRNQSFEHGSTVSGTTARIERFQNALTQAGGNLSGPDRQFLEVTQDVVGWMKGPTQTYEAAYQQFASAGGISPEGLTSKDVIAGRRRMIADCASANEGLIKTIQGAEPHIRAELQRRGVAENDINRFANGYSETAHVGLQLRIRETDRTIFQNIDALLDLLGQTLGRWRTDQGKLRFDKREEAVRYNALFKAMTDAAAEQKTAQQQFIAAGAGDQAKLLTP